MNNNQCEDTLSDSAQMQYLVNYIDYIDQHITGDLRTLLIK